MRAALSPGRDRRGARGLPAKAKEGGISRYRTRAIFDRYNIVSEKDLAEALAKRAAYEQKLTSGQPAKRLRAFPSRASNGK